jgi:hypothetical protein
MLFVAKQDGFIEIASKRWLKRREYTLSVRFAKMTIKKNFSTKWPSGVYFYLDSKYSKLFSLVT